MLDKLFEGAREIVQLNGLPTSNMSVILLSLKFFVEEQQRRLKNQYNLK